MTDLLCVYRFFNRVTKKMTIIYGKVGNPILLCFNVTFFLWNLGSWSSRGCIPGDFSRMLGFNVWCISFYFNSRILFFKLLWGF